MSRPVDTKLAGRWGEAETARYLRERGYEVVGANYKTRFGEIDLIARKGEIIAFVEVKLRKSARFAEAREFVDDRKQKRIRTTAEIYMSERECELQPRFDVAELYAPDGPGAQSVRINYIEDAF